ncbi:MAG: class I tRNA ligase family protein, partial [Roseiarcus sp.]
EIMKFAANGLLYRGSKPVMWSVVEKTALAEAEVEYEDHVSDTVFVAFPIIGVIKDDKLEPLSEQSPLRGAKVVIWTTTPWTIPGNRAIIFSENIFYVLYEVVAVQPDSLLTPGARFLMAAEIVGKEENSLVRGMMKEAKVVEWKVAFGHPISGLENVVCAHPLAGHLPGYEFMVPLLPGDHVTDDTGTGFVHTAPGHGREDFDVWATNWPLLEKRGIESRIPYTVDENGAFTAKAPGFEGRRVFNDKGEKGDANEAVIKALLEAGNLVARGKLRHQYPHSWRSKKPILFRNTPQWFIAMDRPITGPVIWPDHVARRAAMGEEAYLATLDTLRNRALKAIGETRWVPAAGENRIRGMVGAKPDWVMSRQRAWGVPIAVFVRKGGDEILIDDRVNARIAEAFEKEGADAWYTEGAAARFLAPEYDPADFEKIDDILDVWFDSGSTHSYVLEDPVHFPGLAGIRRERDGGVDEVMYLEGSDQHRGWFQSSLLESCGTRGRAPFDVVLTHGFTLDEKGRKMSKSLGNQTFPQDVIKASGADILRLWAASVDYSDDQRIGPEILKTVGDNYRKLRNTIRWMLGTLAHYRKGEAVGLAAMGELERLTLHRLAELDAKVRESYAQFDYARVVAALSAFMNADLSAFYFDIRKDALYCEAPSSVKRRGALEAIDHIFRAVTLWLAPILVFTAEEAWAARGAETRSVHLEQFPLIPAAWRDDALAAKWETIRRIRFVVTGAIEIARADKRIGSSLEASPRVYISDSALAAALDGVDFAEVCITSDIAIERSASAPEGAFRLADAPGVAVVVDRAKGIKCARSWRYFDPATADPEFPDVSPRDAAALRELNAARRL